ncbi:CdaR family protein [uncultured Clostridium sp.]|uniref:CdaR family protein n=1 Tax=uncultured Clostridium sp. TaxID=59620 RepID=UPI0025D38CFE|nr:CdaR family protein [uncultured Clostridium sp.]
MDNGNEKRIVVKLVCVILSFILWLYVSNVENPTRTSDIKAVEVTLENTDVLKDSNLCLKPDQKFLVDLKIEGPANDIYVAKKSDFTIKADLSNYSLKKGENNIPVQIVNSPGNLEIKNSGVLTVKVDLEEIIEKDVKISSKVNTTYKHGLTENYINISPKSVKVSGAESAVNSVDSVIIKGELLNIKEDTQESFDLIAVDAEGNEVKGVTLSESKAKLSIGVVGNVKEVSLKVNYKGNLPEGLTLEGVTLSKDTISITGDINKLEEVDSISTETINLSTITESKDVSLGIILPEGIYLSNKNEKITASIKVKKVETKVENKTTSKKIEGIVVTLNNKQNEKLTYEAESIFVELEGVKEELDLVTSANIVATASVQDITEAGEYEVLVDVKLENTASTIKIKSKTEKIKITVK